MMSYLPLLENSIDLIAVLALVALVLLRNEVFICKIKTNQFLLPDV